MTRLVPAVVMVLACTVLAACERGAGEGPPPSHSASSQVRVERVIDGDTIVLRGGERVRLVQIDTPESMGDAECFGQQATKQLERMLDRGTRVRVEVDPNLDERDQYGRLLGYVFAGPTNVNLELVKVGAANVWFYRGERGQYAAQLMVARRQARSARRGLWAECPKASHQVTMGLETGPVRRGPVSRG